MVRLESYVPLSLKMDKKTNTIIFPVDYKKESEILFSKDTPKVVIDDLKEASSILDLSPR